MRSPVDDAKGGHRLRAVLERARATSPKSVIMVLRASAIVECLSSMLPASMVCWHPAKFASNGAFELARMPMR